MGQRHGGHEGQAIETIGRDSAINETGGEDLLLDLYSLYRRECLKLAAQGRMAPYDWYSLPNTLPIHWLPYAEMVREFAGELANAANALVTAVHRLRAWGELLPTLTTEQQLEAKLEFIDVLGTAALGMPYAIKSRFTYAAAHLCHQANRSVDPTWIDVFPPDETLYLNEIEPICKDWRTFRRFKICLEGIAGSSFKSSSGDFRNSYNHRLPPHLAMGLSGLVMRSAPKDEPVSYVFGKRCCQATALR